MRLLRILRRRAPIALLSLLAVGLATFAGANIYLGTDEGRNRIGERIGRVAGMPVQLEGASVSPWGTVSLRSLRCGGEGGSFVEIERARARIALGSLLRGRVRVREVVLSRPVFRLIPAPELPEGEGSGDLATTPVPDPGEGVPPTPTTGREELVPRVPAPGSDPVVLDRSQMVERFRLEGGEVVSLGADGESERFRITGLAADVEVDVKREARGEVSFENLVVANTREVTGGRAIVTLANGVLAISEGEAACGGGMVRGGLMLHLPVPGMPFRFAVEADGIAAASVLPALEGIPARFTAGRLSGALVGEGYVRAARHLRARAGLRLDDGRMILEEENPDAARALGAQPDGTFTIHRADAVLNMGGGRAFLESGSFGAGPLMLKSSGTLDHTGALALTLRIYLRNGLGEGLVLDGGTPFVRLVGTDWFYRDFPVAGNVRQPTVAASPGENPYPPDVFLRSFATTKGDVSGVPARDSGLRPVATLPAE